MGPRGGWRIDGLTDVDGARRSLVVGEYGHLGAPDEPVDHVIDGSGWTIEPGFVDLQVNGGFGHDVTTEPERIWDVAARLTEHGVTAFLPTLISASAEEARGADAVLSAGPPDGWVGAEPLGLHLEGPAISQVFRGAHSEDRLVQPTAAVVGEWLELDSLRLVTLAPELPGAIEAIERLTDAGVVVSIGHTGATAEQVTAAADAGATMVTHLFNAMAPFHHRDPGVIGAVLNDDRLFIGLIADGIHVAPDALTLAWRAAGPDRIVLTTDAIAAMGTDASGATAAGALAGGTTPFHEVRRRFAEAIGDRPQSKITSGNAHRALGAVGSALSSVVLDAQQNPIATTIDGHLGFFRRPPPSF